MPEIINPRVLIWLRSINLTIKDIARKSGEDVVKITVNGNTNFWTIHYSEWIMEKWNQWGILLGYAGSDAHRIAQANGHTAEEFDAWLNRMF